MALREGQFGELKVPLAWTAAVALAVAAIVAAALFFADRRAVLRDQAYGVARQGFDTVATPVGGVVSAPGRWAGGGVASDTGALSGQVVGIAAAAGPGTSGAADSEVQS